MPSKSQIEKRFLKNWHSPRNLLLKSVSSLQRRLSLRNGENGMTFFYVLWMRGLM